jgi:competence protein ComEC
MRNDIVPFLTASRPRLFSALAALLVLNAGLFGVLGASGREAPLAVSFLDVGQGDASLIEFGDGVEMLIDGGPPNGQLLAELGRLLPPYDRSIELVVLTHPELDHYGGLIDLLERYEVGAFVDTGVAKDVKAYGTLMQTIEERGIRRITLRAGDRIRYAGRTLSVLSPDDARAGAKEKNDTSMVLAFEADGARFLFTGDIGAEVERAVMPSLAEPFDVLKVAHHGSKFSSAAEFLATVRPTLATIGVGKNSYGHPTREALARLEAVGARVFRTDRNGTITLTVADDILRVFAER